MASLATPLAMRSRSHSQAVRPLSASPSTPPQSGPPSAALSPIHLSQAGPHESSPDGGVVMEGYLLKKKRKKMQGMARRYFRLTANGALSYAFNPVSPVRDSIIVSLAFISASRKHRTFHIDGGTTVYHCKALTLEDFDRWAVSLKQFIPVTQASNSESGEALGPVDGPHGLSSRHHAAAATRRDEAVERVLTLLGRLNQPIADIEMLANDLRQMEQAYPQAVQHHQSQQQQQYLGVAPPGMVPVPPANGGSGSKFRFLGKRSNSSSGSAGARSPSFSATAPGANLAPPTPFSLNPGSAPSSSVSGATLLSSSPTFDDTLSGKVSSAQGTDALLRQLSSAVAALKFQHAQLADAVRALPSLAASTSSSSATDLGSTTRGAATHASVAAAGLPVAALGSSHASRAAAGFYPTHSRGAPSRASSRASFVSVWSDGGSDDWHDAMAGVPGEFVDEDSVVPQPGGGDDEGETERESSPERAHHQVEQGSTLDEDEDETDEDDEDSDGDGEETEDEYAAGRRPAAVAAPKPEGDDGDGGSPAIESSVRGRQEEKTVARRSQLPAPVSGDEFSMLSMLRKNVGKDLSTISFPVTMNEPLSALQRLAEELEYSELLDRAAQASDLIERLTLVAVWAVSGASSNKYRGSRKPFNPLLGETYECIRPEKGFRFVSEKVSHHPPVIAFLGDAPERGWQMYGYTSPSTKFWGRSMEILVEGDLCVRFADNDEVFTIRKPSSFVRNLVAGTKYLEVVGDLVVTTSRSAAQATISFKEGSTWGGLSGRNKVEGKVTDANGNLAVELVGRWDDAVDKKSGKNNFTRLWQVADFPPNPERYYGFSRFAVTLNETTALEERLLPPTDSRLRPDQLAFERGEVDEAERLKAVVEEKQRVKRKAGQGAEPRWFRKVGEKGWEYSGDYFEAREKKAFHDPDIFC